MSNGDDIILKKFCSFDDQHDLTCKIKTFKSTLRKRNTDSLQNKYGCESFGF